jgi:methylglyoxal synthase
VAKRGGSGSQHPDSLGGQTLPALCVGRSALSQLAVSLDCATIELIPQSLSGRRAVPPRSGPRRKQIVLIAHDNKKADMLEWARFNRDTLARHDLLGTGTTGSMVANELGLPVHRFLTGPLGGDQQVGAAIAEGRIDVIIFFWDPLEPHPHDVDVKALLRIAVVHNIPMACNRATADFVLSSPLIDEVYPRSLDALSAPRPTA